MAAVNSRPVVRRLPIAPSGFARGVGITVDFDEEQFHDPGQGLYLFASVLESFFSMYCSLNSFSRMTARIKQGERILKQWPPNAGENTPAVIEQLFAEPKRFEFFQAVRLLERQAQQVGSAAGGVCQPVGRDAAPDRNWSAFGPGNRWSSPSRRSSRSAPPPQSGIRPLLGRSGKRK